MSLNMQKKKAQKKIDKNLQRNNIEKAVKSKPGPASSPCIKVSQNILNFSTYLKL